VIESAESDIVVYAVMGGVDIVVPEGIDVDVTCVAIMGGKNVRIADAPPLPGSPRIRIRVYAVMGGVNVRSKSERASRSRA